MTLIQTSPGKRTRNEGFMPSVFGQLMDDFFTENTLAKNNVFSPKSDILEDEKGFHLEISLPGMKRSELKIEINKDLLHIEGERKFAKEENEKTYHRVESNYGAFKRSFTLPDHIKKEEIEAKFEDGILYLFLPKSEKAAPRNIEIK